MFLLNNKVLVQVQDLQMKKGVDAQRNVSGWVALLCSDREGVGPWVREYPRQIVLVIHIIILQTQSASGHSYSGIFNRLDDVAWPQATQHRSLQRTSADVMPMNMRAVSIINAV